GRPNPAPAPPPPPPPPPHPPRSPTPPSPSKGAPPFAPAFFPLLPAPAGGGRSPPCGAGDDDPTERLFHRAWSALGGDPGLVPLVEFTGDRGGLLPSAFAAAPAMSAAVAASTLAASVLDGVRRAQPPSPVTVDREHVAVAARSEQY